MKGLRVYRVSESSAAGFGKLSRTLVFSFSTEHGLMLVRFDFLCPRIAWSYFAVLGVAMLS